METIQPRLIKPEVSSAERRTLAPTLERRSYENVFVKNMRRIAGGKMKPSGNPFLSFPRDRNKGFQTRADILGDVSSLLFILSFMVAALISLGAIIGINIDLGILPLLVVLAGIGLIGMAISGGR